MKNYIHNLLKNTLISTIIILLFSSVNFQLFADGSGGCQPGENCIVITGSQLANPDWYFESVMMDLIDISGTDKFTFELLNTGPTGDEVEITELQCAINVINGKLACVERAEETRDAKLLLAAVASGRNPLVGIALEFEANADYDSDVLNCNVMMNMFIEGCKTNT